MNLNRARQLDLQLLLAFRHLYQLRGLTRAASQMNLSQPAMSRVLAKLRDIFADPLFLRSPQGLQPTPRATQLLPQVQSAIEQMQALIEETSYHPAEDQGRLILCCNDFAANQLLPAICTQLKQQAPGLTVDIRPWTPGLLMTLASTAIDMALCLNEPHGADVTLETLYSDPYVVVMCANHPLANDPVSQQSYLAAEHILIPMGTKQQGIIEAMLASQGIVRRIALRVPYLLAALAMLPGNPYLLTVPSWVASCYKAQFNLACQPLPFATPDAQYCLAWPSRLQNEPRQRWAREQASLAMHRSFTGGQQEV